MSSPSNKPYKSRLLNLINRYYIKFNSQMNVKFREIGYVIQGGLQKAVLPFLWLWQSGKKIGQVFSSSTSNSSLSSSDRDSSSVQTHQANHLIEAVHESLAINPLFTSLLPKNFQGLASILKDKYIVVIVDNNKVKNIIPKSKQENIIFIINNAIKNNQNSKLLTGKTFIKKIDGFISFLKKFSLKIKKQSNNDFLEANQQNKSLLSSNSSESIIINSETGQIMSTVDNLFARFESLIIKNDQPNDLHTATQHIQDVEEFIDKSNNSSHDSAFYLLIQNAIALVPPSVINYLFVKGRNENKILLKYNRQNIDKLGDSKNHKLRIQQQLSGQNKAQYSLPSIKNKVAQDIIESSHHKLQEVLPKVKETTNKIVVKSIDKLQVATNNLNKSIEEDPFQIRLLIIEAINYFFKDRNNKNKLFNWHINNQLLANFHQSEVIIVNDQINDEPWLSWEDLYGEKKSLPSDNLPNISDIKDHIDEENTIQSRKKIANITNISNINHEKTSKFERDILVASTVSIPLPDIPEKSQGNLLNIGNQLTEKTAIEVVEKQNKQTFKKSKKEEAIINGYDETIEAKVIEIKYEKHLLEIILEKLDQLIVWLEENIIKLIAIIKILITNIVKNKN